MVDRVSTGLVLATVGLYRLAEQMPGTADHIAGNHVGGSLR